MRKGPLEDLRDTSLEAVAGYAESYHRVSSQFDRGRDPCPQDRPRGDFLYDVVRLQLTHLNELARLGAAYSFIPARFLERLYARGACAPDRDWGSSDRGTSQPVADPGCAQVLRLEAGEDDRVSFPITVRSACGDQTVHVILSVFRDHVSMKDENKLLSVTLSVDGRPYDDSTGFMVKDSVRLRVGVKVDPQIPKNRTYEARVNILFSNADPQSVRLQLYTLS